MRETLVDEKRLKVLFICTANRARSQIAEALVNNDLGSDFIAFSAGTDPATPHPLAIKALAEEGIDHSGARSKHMDEFADVDFDHVITLCDRANESCPVFFGGVNRHHMGFPDPDKAEGSQEQQLEEFRKLLVDIREKIEMYLLSRSRPQTAVRPAPKD